VGVSAEPNDEVGVLTVDDQASFRSAVREVVRATRGFHTLGEASSAAEALALLDAIEPQLVLMDVWMPGADGIEATRSLLRRCPEAVVVLVSVDAPEQLPRASRACGAAAVLRKQDLGPRMLTELWRRYGVTRRGRSSPRGR
jgi:DNA-binding NarL/FixJ family response regulator